MALPAPTDATLGLGPGEARTVFDFTEQVTRNVLAQLIGLTDDIEENVTQSALASFVAKIGKRKARQRIRSNTQAKVRFVAFKPRGPTGTQICTDLDGRVWDVDDNDIRVPPLHWKCRSHLMYFDWFLPE